MPDTRIDRGEIEDRLLGTSPADENADAARRERVLIPRQRMTFGHAERTPAWQRSYVQRIMAGDAGCAALAAFAGFFARFNTEPADLTSTAGRAVVICAVVLPIFWVAAMGAFRSYEPRFLGVGSEEFHRVLTAALAVVAVVGTSSWAFGLEIARGYVVVAFPIATVLTLVLRYVTRQKLHQRRARGEAGQTVVAVGHRAAVAGMARQLHR
ncbi:MAG: hypothetical protein ACRYF3_12555, partial [Janthinobacterium lividum]